MRLAIPSAGGFRSGCPEKNEVSVGGKVEAPGGGAEAVPTVEISRRVIQNPKRVLGNAPTLGEWIFQAGIFHSLAVTGILSPSGFNRWATTAKERLKGPWRDFEAEACPNPSPPPKASSAGRRGPISRRLGRLSAFRVERKRSVAFFFLPFSGFFLRHSLMVNTFLGTIKKGAEKESC
jgi:hypothetical protein